MGNAAKTGCVEKVRASAYTIPTDAPASDGALTWDSTTVVVEVHAAGLCGVGWTYGAAAVADLVNSKLAGVVTGCSGLEVTAAFEAMVRSTLRDSDVQRYQTR